MERREASAGRWTNGLFEPVVLLGWLLRNAVKIAAIAIALTIAGIGAISLLSFPYRATAIVLVDPRDHRITLQEEVLPSIGADAAVLESMVQIVKSDGFLLDFMRNLGLLGSAEAPLSREEELGRLARFRSNMTVERKGATYLVEISYRAPTGAEAARIANSIAEAFAESQNASRSEATEYAARTLSTQLVEIRARLAESEAAVAKFKADNGIVFVEDRDTLQMRQLVELNQQLALVRNATEEARARYEEHRVGGALTRGQADGEASQLGFLRQQRAQLMQTRDEQAQIYGPRHPRVVQTQQVIEGLERQIAQERQMMATQLKAELDVAVSKQNEIERQIAGLSSDVTEIDAARVQLDALEREAAANRELYQQLLSRNKATDQLVVLANDNVRIVSPAVAPISSTRPPLALLVPVIAFLSSCAAVALVVAGNFGSLRKPVDRRATPRDDAPRQRAASRPATPTPEPYRTPSRSAAGRGSILASAPAGASGGAAYGNGFRPRVSGGGNAESGLSRFFRKLRREW